MSARLYLIYGDEYLVSSRGKELVDSLIPQAEQVFGLEVVDGRADNKDAAVAIVDRCREAIQTMGFMASRKVVWLREANFLNDTAVGKTADVKARVELLAALIKAGMPDGTILVVTSPKIDKRYAFYKECKAAGAEIQEFAVADKAYAAEKQATTVAVEFFRKAGLKVNSEVMAVFLGKAGTDTRQIFNEVEKLSVYMGARKDVTMADINDIVSSSREAAAWDLADAVGKRDLKLAVSVLRQLLFQKESAVHLIIALEHRVRELMIYREGLDNGWLMTGRGGAQWGDVPPALEEMFANDFGKDPRGGHPFRIGLLAEQARRFTPRDLMKCRKAVLDAHEKLVSSSVPELTVLEPLLVQMLT